MDCRAALESRREEPGLKTRPTTDRLQGGSRELARGAGSEPRRTTGRPGLRQIDCRAALESRREEPALNTRRTTRRPGLQQIDCRAALESWREEPALNTRRTTGRPALQQIDCRAAIESRREEPALN